MKTEQEIIKERNKAIAKFKSDSRIEECFHYDKGNCSNIIIPAHSLQRNGVLSLIESDVNGNMQLLNLQNPKINPFGQYEGLEPIGKKTASTFFGFCGKHDKQLFQPIEDREIDINLKEHLFLLSYRGLAREFHIKIEELKGFKNNETFNLPNMEFEQQSRIGGTETAVEELEELKKELNEILKNKTYDKLEYVTHTIPYCIPVACSSSFTPKHYLSNEIFNHSEDHNVKYESLFLSVIPRVDKTHIVYSCLKTDLKSAKFINELRQLDDLNFQAVTSSLIIGNIHNTFLSPKLFDELEVEERKLLMDALEITDKVGVMIDQFYHIGINLFDEKNKRK